MPWRSADSGREAGLQDGAPPSDDDQQRYFEARMADALACSRKAGGLPAAVIVDPATGEVVAEAVDAAAAHPLSHAVMEVLERAARRDRELWPMNPFVHYGRNREGSCGREQGQQQGGAQGTQVPATPSVDPSLLQQQQGEEEEEEDDDGDDDGDVGSPRKKLRVGNGSGGSGGSGGGSEERQQQQGGAGQAAAASAVGGAAAARGPAEGLAAASAPLAAASVAAAAAAALTDPVAPPPGAPPVHVPPPADKPYLCTGWDAFLTHEPCAMCAMALVHSRLARVVYCKPDAKHGVLGGGGVGSGGAGGASAGAVRLHAQRSLNHHYEVWRLPLQGEE